MGFRFVSFLLAGLALKAHAGYLTAKDIENIKAYWPDYKYAAEKVGVPVAVLPAIHYREAGLYPGWYSYKRRTVTKNLGGPFMLDLGPREGGPEFEQRIRDYEIKVYRKLIGRGEVPKVSHNFKFAALVAAYELKTKLRSDKWTYDALADAVWGYNGRSKLVSMSKNPYLWSHPKKHKLLTAKYRDKKGEIVEYLDKRPGVMVLYAEILGLMESGQLP